MIEVDAAAICGFNAAYHYDGNSGDIMWRSRLSVCRDIALFLGLIGGGSFFLAASYTPAGGRSGWAGPSIEPVAFALGFTLLAAAWLVYRQLISSKKT